MSLINSLTNVMRGLRAFTIQPYTEANVKNGLQYYARRAFRGAAVGGVTGGAFTSVGDKRCIYFQTGSKPVIVKDRAVKYIGEEFSLSLYAAPTVAQNAGVISVSNYRADGGAIATTVTAHEVLFADVTSVGTPIDDPEFYFGGSAAGQRIANNILEGRERIIPASSNFLVVIEMTAGTSGRFEYFLDWYEGGTDLPRKELKPI